jgi:hypothetical protein
MSWLEDDEIVFQGFFIVLFAALTVYGIYWCTASHTVQAQVVELHWRHRLDLRERREWHDADWGHAPKRKGFYREATWDEKCQMKTNGVYCAAHDAKNNCILWLPDEDLWCSYKYWEWPAIDSTVIEGEGHETSWPTYGNALDDNHREAKVPSYRVTFANGDRTKTWTYKTDSNTRYAEFQLNDFWVLRIPNVGPMTPEKKASIEQP